MKKTILILCAALALCACSKVQPVTIEEPMEETPSVPMTFNLTVNHPDADVSKALKDGWEAGDVVYVFFNNITYKYIKKTFDGTSWTDTYPGGDFEEGDFDSISDNDKLMTAVYIPHYNKSIVYENGNNGDNTSSDPVPIVPLPQTVSKFRIDGDYTYYMVAQRVPYLVSGTAVSGTLDMGKPYGFVQFFVPGIAEDEAPLYRLREANGHLTPKACESVTTKGIVCVVDRPRGYCLKGFPYKGGVLFAGYLSTAGTAADYSFQLVKNVSTRKDFAEGTYLLQANKTIPMGVVVHFPALSSWSYGKWVDMGSAGKWATGNLTDDGGTTVGEANIVAPDEAGKYYAWGETVGYEPVNDYSFSHLFNYSNYKLITIPDLALTKYCYDAFYGYEGFTDTLTELESADDAATQNLGPAWRLPTYAECIELVNTSNFLWLWRSSNDYVIYGNIVFSGDTGLSLFLPAAGWGDNFSFNDLRECGKYWTTTLSGVSPFKANYLSFGYIPPSP